MNRLSAVLLLVIALVAGVAGGTMYGRTEFPAVSSGLAGDSVTAHAFYDAFDRALAGESAESLAALLAPGFLDHDASLGEEQNADEFLTRIRALGESGGSERLTVDSVHTSGSNVIAQVRYASTGAHPLASISIEQPANEPVVEVLRVAQGRIVERWTPGHWSLQVTTLEDEVLFGIGPAGYVSTLARLSIPAKAEHDWYPVGSGFVTIESGAARMSVTHFTGKDETTLLEQGAGIKLESGDHIALRSADGAPVTALIYSLVRRSASDVVLAAGAADAQKHGVSQSILWSGPMAQTDRRTVHRLGMLVLPAGKDVRLTETAHSTLLVSADSGALEASAPDGVVSILGDDLWPVEHPNFAGIAAPRAASISGASQIVLHNVSDLPVTVTMVVVHDDARPYPLMEAAPLQ